MKINRNKTTSNKKTPLISVFVLSLAILLATPVVSAQGFATEPGLPVAPGNSSTTYVLNTTSLNQLGVSDEKILLDGISVDIEGSDGLNCYIMNFEDKNIDENGKTWIRVKLEGGNQPVDFRFSGLPKNTEYTIYKNPTEPISEAQPTKTSLTTLDGELDFESDIGSVHTFVIATGDLDGGATPIPPGPEETDDLFGLGTNQIVLMFSLSIIFIVLLYLYIDESRE